MGSEMWLLQSRCRGEDCFCGLAQTPAPYFNLNDILNDNEPLIWRMPATVSNKKHSKQQRRPILHSPCEVRSHHEGGTNKHQQPVTISCDMDKQMCTTWAWYPSREQSFEFSIKVASGGSHNAAAIVSPSSVRDGACKGAPPLVNLKATGLGFAIQGSNPN